MFRKDSAKTPLLCRSLAVSTISNETKKQNESDYVLLELNGPEATLERKRATSSERKIDESSVMSSGSGISELSVASVSPDSDMVKFSKEVKLDVPSYVMQKEYVEECIRLLRTQIRKRNCKYGFASAVFLGVLGFITGDITRCARIFNNSHDIYMKTVDNWGGRHSSWVMCPQAEFPGASIGGRNFFDLDRPNCLDSVRYFQGNRLFHCSSITQQICDGPGMWGGYFPVMLLIGIVVLGIATCTFTCCIKTPKTNKMIVDRAKLYGIKIPAGSSLQSQLELFQNKLSAISYSGDCRFEFMLFMRRQNQKDDNAPLKIESEAQRGICREIFEFAGIDNSLPQPPSAYKRKK